MSLSPIILQVALHYHYMPTDFVPLDAPMSRSVADALSYLCRVGLLKRVDGEPGSQLYKPTDGLHLFVERLCETPLPKRGWSY